MANVVLISLHHYFNREPLGIRCLSSILKQANHKVSIVSVKKYCAKPKRKNSYNNCHEIINQVGEEIILPYPSKITNREKDLLLELLYKLNPNFIGFSLSTVELWNAISLTNLIKRKFTVPIVWGGIEPTIEPDKCIKIADIICIGEGDGAIIDLANAIDRDEDFRTIKNLWIREKNGKIIKNKLRPLIQELDSLPLPDVSCEDRYLIDNNEVTKLKEKDFFYANYDIMTSRGCAFSCSYCFNSYFKRLYLNQKYLRRRSPENVINELKLAKAIRRPNRIEFQDDVFTFNKKWIEEFAALYKKEIGIPFSCYAHPLVSDRRVIELLRDAGLSTTIIGIQSGSQRVLKKIYNRNTSIHYIMKSLKTISNISPEIMIDLITNNPLENEEDCKITLEMLLKISTYGKFVCDISKLSIFPNYDIAWLFKEKNIIPRIDKMYKFDKSKLHSFYTKLYLLTQSKLPRNWIRKLSESKFLMNHQYIFKLYFVPWKYYRLSIRVIKLFLKTLLPQSVWSGLKKRLKPK
jgi:radical SAM superfamily enzyme YgiQ (UPF0313 family)